MIPIMACPHRKHLSHSFSAVHLIRIWRELICFYFKKFWVVFYTQKYHPKIFKKRSLSVQLKRIFTFQEYFLPFYVRKYSDCVLGSEHCQNAVHIQSILCQMEHWSCCCCLTSWELTIIANNLPDVGYDAKFCCLSTEKKTKNKWVLVWTEIFDGLVWTEPGRCGQTKTHLQRPPPRAPLLVVWRSSMLDRTGCQLSWQWTAPQEGCPSLHPCCSKKQTTHMISRGSSVNNLLSQKELCKAWDNNTINNW